MFRARKHQHEPARGGRPLRSAKKPALAAAVVGALTLSGCTALDPRTITVTVGYQSRTINTVNAGTLMRDRDYFEEALAEVGEETNNRYRVVWQDYSSGAPLTAAMIASHVDIGSMGDYPLLTNGSSTAPFDDAATEFVATTGYNLRGSLNQVVVPTGSDATDLDDLVGQQVSTSLGSAADGMLSTALQREGIDLDDVPIVNQDPSIGAAAVEGNQVDALAQFVPWPQMMVFRNQGRLLYDGGNNEVPTFHGVVARKQFTGDNPEVMDAFLTAMERTNDFILSEPLQAAVRIGEITGIEPEVTYLYNGPNGLVSFDPTIKDDFDDSLAQVRDFLVERGSVEADFDVEGFINDSYLRDLLGDEFDSRTSDVSNPNVLTGEDEICDRPVDDPATASEVWYAGHDSTVPAATPSCLLQNIASSAESVRAGYVPDTETGLKLFAEHSVWVEDPDADPEDRFLPFATQSAADGYVSANPGTEIVDFDNAVSMSRPIS